MFDAAPLTRRWGTVVRARGAATVSALPRPEIIELLKTSGAVLFSGFEIDGDGFKTLTESFGHSFVTNLHAGSHRDMVSDEGRTSTVNLGNKLVGHHCELSYSPLRPELLWFLCVHPASKGGETFLADGVELWSKMGAELKARFSKKRIKYSFPRADRNVWPVYTGAWTGATEASQALGKLEGVSHRLNTDGTIDIEYVTDAALPTRWGTELAFVNSVIVHDQCSMFFEDGEPITEELKWDLLALAHDLTEPIKWRAGEVLLIDNTRMMHGRMPFTDPTRRIHVRMSNASF